MSFYFDNEVEASRLVTPLSLTFWNRSGALQLSPRGNLMEEGMGVPARGGRRESWAPPDVGSAHPTERAFTVYRFRPGPARPAAAAFPSVRRFLTVRTCLWARFEKFPRTIAPRSCPRLHRAASPRGNLMEEEWGMRAGGGRRESWAPPDLGSAHPAERAFTVYRFPPAPTAVPPPHRARYDVPVASCLSRSRFAPTGECGVYTVHG